MKIIFKILKKIMIVLFTIIGIIVLVAAIFINTSPQFGGKPSEESLVKINRSPNYNGNGTFKNLELTLASTGLKLSTFPKFFTNGNNKTPNGDLPMEKVSKKALINKENQPTITWFGHSAVFIEMEHQNIFIDPMLGDVPAPHPWLGSNRFQKELPISIDSLPNIDVVLISHDHYDHLDYGSIKKLKDKVNQFYVPLGVKAHLVTWGVEENKVKELDWWESIELNGIEYVSTPARHFSGRGLTRNNTLWTSWVLKSENSNIFFSGDSGYGKHFKEIGEKYGPFDFAMMECGQYNEQWAHIHMSPEETIQAAVDVKSKLTMPIHWGSFKLALHSWDDPILRATKKAEELNVKLTTPIIGEPIQLKGISYPMSQWWKN